MSKTNDDYFDIELDVDEVPEKNNDDNILSTEEIISKICEIMLSGTEYASAIALTIDACYRAFKEETEITELKKELKDIRKRVGVHKKGAKTIKYRKHA